MKQFDFIGKSKTFFAISSALIIISLVCAVLFGIPLDIEFKGGAILTYSYEGSLDTEAFKTDIETALGEAVTIQETVDFSTGKNNIVANLAVIDGIDANTQLELTNTLTEKYADNNLESVSVSVVDPVIGTEFLQKSLVAVIFASLIMIVYVSLRFKLISGWSAGITAVIALIHDVLIVFGLFVIFRIPLNDNFIAVILTILGYSLNDTIVIYDRVRENKNAYGNKLSTAELMNKSLNQSLARSIMTTVTTATTMAVVSAVAYYYNVTSILTFSIPMMIGMISGVYSSLCIAAPLWVVWQDKKANKA